MAESDPKPLDRKSLSDDKERMRVVEAVLRDQARREVLRDIAYRRPSASLRTRVVAGVLGLVALAAWTLPLPVFQPDIPFPLPPAEEEGALRIATYIQAQQVEAFRLSSGRLPDQLRETGEALPGITYEKLDARTYTLNGATERTSIRWISSDSAAALLGETGAERLRSMVP